MSEAATPDNVICPNCCIQFRAIPEDVQAQLAEARELAADRGAEATVKNKEIGRLKAEVEKLTQQLARAEDLAEKYWARIVREEGE